MLLAAIEGKCPIVQTVRGEQLVGQAFDLTGMAGPMGSGNEGHLRTLPFVRIACYSGKFARGEQDGNLTLFPSRLAVGGVMPRGIILALTLILVGCGGEPTWGGKTARAWRRDLKSTDYT